MITYRRRRKWLYGLVALLLLAAYSYWALVKPLPLLQPINYNPAIQIPAAGSVLSWPAQQSAVGILGDSEIETHGPQTPVPTASTAKIITCLVVLSQKPLAKGQSGPTVTLTDADVDLYKNYEAQDGSLVPVVAGETITEYQMLQAILLPSANNMADSLAIWAFGSLKAYAAEANTFLAKNGLTSTHVGDDASGLSPTTTSTARDLVKLGKLAMQNSVLAEIVAQPTASGIPQTTSIKNVNLLLGSDGIIGIKTGNSDQAGGVFVSASQVTVNSKPVIIVTALAGSPTLFQALKDSQNLIKSAQANFTPSTLIKAGDKVGQYDVPWGQPIDAIATNSLTTVNWRGSATSAQLSLKPAAYNSQPVGTITLPGSIVIAKQSIPVKLKSTPAKPSALWRLTHVF